MPPKRKLSTPKSASNTPIKAAAGAMRTSPVAKRRNSLAGGKTSRLAPSEPLHMTTRRAAKTASNHSTPVASSSATSGSRRSSLNDVAPFENAHSDTDDERPAKRNRLSTDSGSPQRSHGSFADQTPVNGAQSPVLPKPEPVQDPEPVVDSNLSKPSSKKRRASDDSMQSTNTDSARPNGLPTGSQSDPSEQQPRRKKRKTTEPPADLPDQPPELTDASTAPNSPEQIADVESSQILQNVLPTADAPAKLGGRRLPGRRRQPHSDVNVETDLRRQLNLKMSYRSLAKVHKTILEELSNRTINNLENEPDFYRRCPEYEPMMAALDDHRDKRLAQLNALRSNKLDQLERVRKASEYIEREQYINRFRDLQDDALLQCYHRMKQIEREAKRDADAATDDEDHIVEATYKDGPVPDADDRIDSKFASRSRAYVETERLLDHEETKKQFNFLRQAFVAKDDDADDSIGDTEAFATFIGPDRTDAIAHYNIACLTDAALELERTPPPAPEPPKVIPNEEADALFALASLSADQPRGILIDEKNFPEHNILPPIRELTPMLKEEPNKDLSPVRAPAIAPLDIAPMELPPINSDRVPQASDSTAQGPPHHELNGTQVAKEKESVPTKSETPVRVSTHRIMDLLNDDQEVRPPKSREYPNPMIHGGAPRTPSRQDVSSQNPTPSQSGVLRLDAIMHNHEQPIGRHMAESSIPLMNNSPTSPHSSWAARSIPPSRDSEESLKRRDPLLKIRDLLDRKGREPSRPMPERPDFGRSRYEGNDPTSQPVQVLSSAFTPQPPQERSEVSERDARKHSIGAYGASPTVSALPYNQSPGAVHTYPPSTRHGSQDHGTPHWDRDRRMSGSQAIQPPGASPYQSTHAQPYQGEHNATARTPPKHQSPYPPPSSNAQSSLPPKPPGPPSSGPTNFRFAHYDPAPPRTSYPHPPASSNYPPAALPPPPPSGPPPPPYTSGYTGPPAYQSGYVPPPGSFQAPPPPPPSQNVSSYPPLKIHQYGGTPILPATLAPPAPHSQPMTFVGQAPAPPQSYSPPQQPAGTSRNPSYDAARDGQSERPADPQARPRRQYRSYHAPGTQFRSYQGPDSGRRRGG